ncbi:hypothetical protein SULI_00160 [Saccharolobus solfataricus]|nr:hypothetical protein [Saccharolobus solfataricus]AKA74977.1 hypothetical protein SULB_0032 [Saccharolobus solfataricus]AKA77672.1 hypothetical protein SULC_0031 [Saccharolobus solfataricus]AKA80362.1 hypothetical protein SULA_0031 [Saccharolobus solfataricus]AZF69441.1 hypothetical protein SULG_00160 [Saccharolobus solfataricus]AZF72061.1 hypothetical protein SULH_00160 [Saccharolobus solfataricus]
MVEKGTLVSIEEFKSNRKLKESVKNGIKGLVKLLFQEADKIIKFDSNEDLIFQLMKLGLISPTLAQELLDILKIADNLDNVDDEILYSMLVRIMEDVEEAINNIGKYMVKNSS